MHKLHIFFLIIHKIDTTKATNRCLFFLVFYTRTSGPWSRRKSPQRRQLHSLVQNKVEVKSSIAGRSRLPPAVRLCGSACHQQGHQHGHFHGEQDQPAVAAAAAAAGHHHQLCTPTAKEREKVNRKKERRKRKKYSPGGSFFIHSHSLVMLSTMVAISSLLPGPLGRWAASSGLMCVDKEGGGGGGGKQSPTPSCSLSFSSVTTSRLQLFLFYFIFN